MEEMSDEEFLATVVIMNSEFRRRFGKDLGITGAFGEVDAAQRWSMNRAKSHIQPGYDCVLENCRVEVKCGVNRHSNSDTTSAISSHPFDKLLYIHYDENYKIRETFVLSASDVNQLLSTKRKRVLNIGEIRRLGRKIGVGDKF